MRKLNSMASLVLLISGAAMAAPQQGNARGDEVPAATSELLAQYPGTQTLWQEGRINAIYGMPMTEGDTADAAAEQFVALHKLSLGVPNLELTLKEVSDIDYGRMRVYVYNQSIGGVPVEFGFLRVLVLVNRPGGERPAVVYAGGRLAQGDASSIPADTISSEQALAFVQNIAEWKKLPVWSKPQLVVFYGEGDLPQITTPIHAWKIEGEQPLVGTDGDSRTKHTFFVDAAGTGLKAVRDEICHADVTGVAQAYATPGTSADWSGNAPVLMAFPWLKVGITGGATAFSDATGAFTITNSGTSAVTVGTDTGTAFGGQWVYVNNTNGTGATLTASQTVTPPGPATLVLNPAPSEFLTAQVNAVLAGDVAHNFIKDRAPTYTNLDARLPANVNLTSTCNAYYDGASINFYRSGGGCNNTAFSNVVAHEYGHHIVNRHGVAQNSFGEGFGDCVGMLAYGDSVVGRYFTTGGGAVRDPDNANIQYPCTGNLEIHYCGQQLAGMWWEVKKNFDTKYGTAGLERVRQLFVNWHLITAGGESTYNSIGAQTAVEVLTVNDNDGNLNNGTPDYSEIKNAFCAHSVNSPVINYASISLPNGAPAYVTPAATGTPVDFVVTPGVATVTPGTGRLLYRTVGSTIFLTAPWVETSPNHYTATIPSISCRTSIEYYFQASTSGGQVFYPSASCSSSTQRLSATSAYSVDAVFSDDFETDRGWSFGVAGDTATLGQWERGVPELTAAQPGNGHTSSATNQCAITGRAAGTGVGSFDIDNGKTTLLSPVINLAGKSNVYINYWRWFSNNGGSNPNEDTMVVEVSNDNGTTWTTFETVGPTTQNTGGWINKSARLDVAGLPALTSQMRFRFVPSDAGVGGSVVEAALDDFSITAFSCTPPCAADFNGDNSLDFFDYLDFVSAFSSGAATADFNHDNSIDFFDYLDFVDAFSTGC